ncbi:hypothetical protein HQ545_01445 [Candidatus Woesearchaeota archaeon]|nr:hypothetical protein [Candidatus Woesearchaeota archaeon]
MSYIEVDQSGKIEDLRQNTVVAFSNDTFSSAYLDRRIKREILFEYRHKVKQIVQKMFAICLFYLLEEHIENKHTVIICKEYTGWEELIKRQFCRLLNKDFGDVIQFRSIGKKSKAHTIALLTNRNVLKYNKKLSKKDILKYLK